MAGGLGAEQVLVAIFLPVDLPCGLLAVHQHRPLCVGVERDRLRWSDNRAGGSRWSMVHHRMPEVRMAFQRNTTIEDFLRTTRVKELSPTTTVDERIAILEDVAAHMDSADLDDVFRVAVRGQVIAALKESGETSAARLYDSVVRSATRSSAAGSMSLIPADPEPWPEPVDGADLLTDIADYVDRYLVLPAGAAIVIAAWSMATWCVDHLFFAPILALLSPTKQSGKTLALSILRRLVKRPLPITDVTTAGTFRVMHVYRPTLLWDEAECLGQRGNAQQIGILNSGYQRGTPVFRCVGEDNMPEAFHPFGFRAVGAIGTLASTLIDRSIIIPLKRAPRRRDGDTIVMTDEQGNPKELFDEYTANAETLVLRRRIARWAEENGYDVGRNSAAPETMQSWLGFRGSRNWAPLLEIGRRSAEAQYERLLGASRNLTELCALTDDDEREMLIRDIADVFRSTGADDLGSTELASILAKREDRPWCEYAGGRPLTPHRLSRLLQPFGIKPTQFRSPQKGKIRGYSRTQFDQVFRSFDIDLDPAA